MVVKRSVNEHEVIPLLNHFRRTGILRFIEFMDVGSTNGWRMNDVLTAQEILETSLPDPSDCPQLQRRSRQTLGV